MKPEMRMIRCTIMRGGTSKGIFLRSNDIPKDTQKRDEVIRAIFGSPDVRQIDGLGGADVLTSKLAIIAPSTDERADVDYTFGQVSFENEIIDYKGNCGNISSAVGPFAIDEGLVKAVEPITTVKIRQTNSDTILIAEVPVRDGRACVEGDFKIDGVPGTGAKIAMNWCGTVGCITGSVLPTGNPKDVIEINKGIYEVSVVDAGNVVVFIKATELGMEGTETPAQIESDKKLMDLIEEIRGKVASLIGLVKTPDEAKVKSPYNPFFAIVSKPKDYVSISGDTVKADQVDLVSRLLFMLRMHKTYPITGTVCTGAASRIPGSIVWETVSEESRNSNYLRIGHPGGVIPIEVETEKANGNLRFTKLSVYRTARRIMDGYVYVREKVFQNGD